MKEKNIFWIVFLGGVLAFFSSLFGIDEDQVLGMEAAVRMIAGQLPYREFMMPHGAVAGILFMPFAYLLPTLGIAQIVATVFISIVAILLSYVVVRKITDSQWYAELGALFTALSFMPIVGSYYHDQVAYLFLMLVGVFVLYERPVLAGIALTLAFHTKQTVGVAGGIALAVVMLLQYRRMILPSLIGFIGSQLAVFGLIWHYASIANYWHYAVVLPAQFAAANKSSLQTFTEFLFPFHVNPLNGMASLFFYPIVLMVYGSYVVLAMSWKRIRESDHLIMVLFFLVSTVLCSAQLGRGIAQEMLGIGLVFAITLWMAKEYLARWMVNAVIFLFCTVSVFFVAFYMRMMTDAVVATGELFPLVISGDDLYGVVDPIQLNDMAQYLTGREGAIATIDDSVAFVPLLVGKTPTDPFLYYHYGLTVPINDGQSQSWQWMWIDALKDRNVQFVVLLKDGVDRVVRTDKEHGDIHLIRNYLNGSFQIQKEIGNLLLLVRRSK